MTISVIIVSWNVRELLKHCLESIFKHAQGVDYEVILIDNASSDGTVEWLEQNFFVIPAIKPALADGHRLGRESSFRASGLDSGSGAGMTIRLIQNLNNKGFAAANNQGIGQAKGKYILLLNPDTEFIEDTLTKVAQLMQLDENFTHRAPHPYPLPKGEGMIGVLGCQLLNPDGSIQPSVRRFPTVWSQLVILTKLHHIWPSLLNHYLARDFNYSLPPVSKPAPHLMRGTGQALPLLAEEGIHVVEVDQVMGAFFCVRREVFDKIGLLDEGYFIWFEEVDFCRRAKKAGYKVVYWPGIRVIHHGAQSFKQQMTLKKQWWFFKSALRYFLLSSRTPSLSSRTPSLSSRTPSLSSRTK